MDLNEFSKHAGAECRSVVASPYPVSRVILGLGAVPMGSGRRCFPELSA